MAEIPLSAFMSSATQHLVRLIRRENPRWGRDQVGQAVQLARLARGPYGATWRKYFQELKDQGCLKGPKLFHKRTCRACLAGDELGRLDKFAGMVIRTDKIDQLRPGRQLDRN